MAEEERAEAAAASSGADAGAGQTLLAKHLGKNKGVPKARVAKLPTIEAAVQKSIRDNFKGWPALATHETQVAGDTLYSTILKDRQSNQDVPGTVVMGAQYYRVLKERFAGSGSAYNQLVVVNTSEPVTPALMTAVVALKNQNCLKAPMLEFLMAAGSCNQKELVGILRGMCLLRPCASPAQLQLILECMRYITRNKLDTLFPNEIKLMRDQWDAALLCALKSFKKLNEDPEAWYNNYKDLLTASHAPQTSNTNTHTTNHTQTIALHNNTTVQYTHIHTHLDAQVFKGLHSKRIPHDRCYFKPGCGDNRGSCIMVGVCFRMQ